MSKVVVDGRPSGIGFFLTVSNERLRKHVLGRVGFHSGRVKIYSENLVGLAAAESDEDDDPMVKNYSGSRSPVDQIRERIQMHRKRVEFFTFIAENIDESTEVYQLLDWDDLARLEVGA